MAKNSPKYLELIRWIEEEIQKATFEKGAKFYSENKIAEISGLSRQTVRHAVSVLEQRGILERRKGSGTFISQPIAPKKITKKIGMLSTYQESYIFPNIIRGVDEVISDAGYTIQFSLTHNRMENERRGLLLMLEQEVDGIIVEPTKSGLPNQNIELYEEIKRRGIPLIFFNAYYPDMDFPCVSMDDLGAGKLATRHLISKGHTRIAGIFQSDDRQGPLRYSGYVKALNKAKIPLESRNVMWFATEDIPYFEQDIGRVMRYIEGCTGLVCYNDQIAYFLYNELKKQGIRVPRDISIVGIDNSEYANMCEVPITSVAHPMEELGRVVAHKILDILKNPTIDANVKFPPILIERNSVKDVHI